MKICPICTNCGLCTDAAADIEVTGIINTTQPTKTSYSGCGIIVDIGTTTVYAACYDLSTGQIISQSGTVNKQTQYAPDVISRIQYAQSQMGTQALHYAVMYSIDEVITKCNIPTQPDKAVITGNTVMLHLFAGYGTTGMMQAPFIPESLFGIDLPVSLLKIQKQNIHDLFPDTVYIPPCLSAFDGADILCAVLSVLTVRQQQKNFLLLDIGTNCEIAFYDSEKEQVFCTAVAAGPAFEGGGMNCGMPALPGAIADVRCENGDIKIKVIGGTSPRGLCGTGFVSAVASFLDAELISPQGIIRKDCRKYAAHLRYTKTGELSVMLNRTMQGQPLCITQKDINNLQTAAAAVAAGIQTLLKHANHPDFHGDIFLCGGFGTRLHPIDAQRIGLFTNAESNIISCGNEAASGAALLLLRPDLKKKAEQLAANAQTIQLAQDKYFQTQFINCMTFPENKKAARKGSFQL